VLTVSITVIAYLVNMISSVAYIVNIKITQHGASKKCT